MKNKIKRYYSKSEPRFSFQELDDEVNIPDLQKWVYNNQLVGLIDEDSGGIIGYINRAHENTLYQILNKQKHLKS